MATINQKFTGDGKQLEREYDKLLKQQVKLEEQLRDVKRSAEATGRSQKAAGGLAAQGAKKAVDGIRSMAASYIGVQQAIRLVIGEMKEQEAMERKAAMTSMSVADAEAQVAINIGDVSTPDLQAFISTVAGIREQTGFQSQVPLLMAASTTLSATAGDQKLTADVLANVAPLFKSAPEDMATASQAVGDLASLSEASAKETMGLVLSTMGQARVTSLAAFSNVAPAIAAGVNSQKGTAPKVAARETAAAFAAIGNQIKDPEGALTKGAVAALSMALGAKQRCQVPF